MRVHLGFRWKHVWSERCRILSTLLGKKPKGRVSTYEICTLGFIFLQIFKTK